MVFIHIAVPLFLLFIMWIHLQRTSRPKVNPPRGLALGTLLTMLALSFAYPALSQGPANLDTVPTVIQLDWFYLAGYPLAETVPGAHLWIAFVLFTGLLIWMPWLPPKRRVSPAEVHLTSCNGCGRCVADCPFNAITMEPRSDGKPFTHEAVVNPRLCVACGICVGACPPTTPFRRSRELETGIDLPELPLVALRDLTLAAAEGLAGEEGRVLVYGCRHGPALEPLKGPGVGVVTLPCTAMLAPSFMDFVISRDLADGVLLTGCREGDCHHRQGIDWMEQRIAGERDPRLRRRVPRERVATSWPGLAPGGKLEADLAAFRRHLATLGRHAPPSRREAPRRTTTLERMEGDD